METCEIPGLFSGNVKIYHYPSNTPSKRVLLVLKGIYGEHIPGGNSWDNALVKLLQNDYHLIFIRTSRLNNKEGRDAFVDKSFEQECAEVESVFNYCNKNIFHKDPTWGAVGVSFGGTTLLWVPKVLSQMKAVIMIGSGCGKNTGTTKPLLSTLPETEQLLHSLNDYHNAFTFLHGEFDDIVPNDSQQLIYGRASLNSPNHRWVTMKNLDHSLRETATKESKMAEAISHYIRKDF